MHLYDTFETDKHVHFVIELCTGGDLLNYVRKRRRLTEVVAKHMFKQIAEALLNLEYLSIVHRDIKLDNILLDKSGMIKVKTFANVRLVILELVNL